MKAPTARLAAGIVVVGTLLCALASPAAACSGAMVGFPEIRAEATRIVVGTIVGIRGDAEAPDAIGLQVEAVIRGTSPAELILEPPVYMGCDGRIAEPIGSRLVVATGSRYFDAAPPGDIHAYWRIQAGDIVEPAGVDPATAPTTTLGELVTALGERFIPVEAEDPPADSVPVDGDGGAGGFASRLGLVLAIVIGVAVISAAVIRPLRR